MTNELILNKSQFYAPLSFVRGFDESVWCSEILEEIASEALKSFEGDCGGIVYFRELGWDSVFFKSNFLKIEFLIAKDIGSTKNALNDFLKFVDRKYDKYYISAEIPSEDISTIVALCDYAFRLVETRIVWFRDDIQKYEFPSRSEVRSATTVDIDSLKIAASRAVNLYDKYHADEYFSSDTASKYLETFVSNSVNGFADVVLVPRVGVANAFLTGDFLGNERSIGGKSAARMVLSAVVPERSGWYTKLISEMSFLFKENAVDVAFMTTQATNRAVIKVWQRLGYKYGRSTHVFSKFKK